jgi:hypothetical protein
MTILSVVSEISVRPTKLNYEHPAFTTAAGRLFHSRSPVGFGGDGRSLLRPVATPPRRRADTPGPSRQLPPTAPAAAKAIRPGGIPRPATARAGASRPSARSRSVCLARSQRPPDPGTTRMRILPSKAETGSIGLPSPISTADSSRTGSLGLTTRDRLRTVAEVTTHNWIVELMYVTGKSSGSNVELALNP